MMSIPAALTAVAPAFGEVFVGFDAVLRNGLVPQGTPTIAQRVDALAAALTVQMPAQQARIMEHVRAAEANIAADATGATAAFATISALLSGSDDRWRHCLSVAWDLASAQAYGRWT
jgi:hypothetical protein